jgi:uncharacterized protein YabN with tetrapyrrole methylase and pyrophosphatase domain
VAAANGEQLPGSLSVVGTGIRVAAQTSPEAIACIERAQSVFFLAADALTEPWLRQLNPAAESLHGFYAVGKNRTTTYEEIAEHIVGRVREGRDVCFVSYGHPGVCATPMHEAMRRVRAEGYPARMLPGISAEDCLFADLGVDPGKSGCQTFEATDFLVCRRKFDPRSALILWQIGVIGEPGYKQEAGVWNARGLSVLRDELLQYYPASHKVFVYEAPAYVFCDPVVQEIALEDVLTADVSALSTLYVPPIAPAVPDPEMLRRLDARELRYV